MDKQQSSYQSNIFPQKHYQFTHSSSGALISKQEIKNGSLLFSIQSSNTFSAINICEHVLDKNLACFEKININEDDIIALYLLHLRQDSLTRNNKHLEEWIRLCSSGFINFKKQWLVNSEDEQLLIEYLAYKSFIKEKAVNLYKLCRKNKEYFLNLNQRIFEQQTSFISQYIWASQFRNTRAFGYTQDTLLIPFMDFMNYDPSQNCHKVKFVTYNNLSQLTNFQKDENQSHSDIDDYQQENNQEQLENKKYIGLLSLQTIKQGQQILFHYGRYSNGYLLRWYGYSVQNNPYDYIKIYLKKQRDAKDSRMIYFSEVQRSTHPIKLRNNKICIQFLEYWLKANDYPLKLTGLYETQITKEYIQLIDLLIIEMNQTKQYLKDKCGEEDKDNIQIGFINIYLNERKKIYLNQKQLLQKYLQKLLSIKKQ